MSGPRILIIRCGAVGDTVFATAVLDPLLEAWPEARIEWLATPAAAALFGADPRIRRVHRLRHRKLPLWLSPAKRRLRRAARRAPFDLVLNLEGAPYFQRLAHALRARRVVCFGDGRDFAAGHAVESHRSVVAQLGLPLEHASPRLVWREPDFALPEAFVVLHPGNSHANARRPNIRAWPEAHWRALCVRLHAAGINVVVTGAPAEAALAARVAGTEGLCLAGRTDVPTMAGVLHRSRLLVCSDTGPVHIAAAVGGSILGLYGPTRPVNTAPYAPPERVRLIRHEMPCSPCYGTPRYKQCRDNRCMQAITVEEVAAAVLGWPAGGGGE